MDLDPLADRFDGGEARRFRERPELSIADALLDQRLVAGAGQRAQVRKRRSSAA